MLGELTKSQIDNVLYSAVVGRLGCHSDDLTYVVPITYAYWYLYIRAYQGRYENRYDA
jgi:hypothetical protein